MKGILMQTELACVVLTMTRLKLCGDGIQWKCSWNTLLAAGYYDLRRKSMIMNMCLTNLKEMGRAICGFPGDQSGEQLKSLTIQKKIYRLTESCALPLDFLPASSGFYSGPNYPVEEAAWI